MKKIKKKEINDSIKNALYNVLSSLPFVASSKLRKMVESSSKKITGKVKQELKKQDKKENDLLKKAAKASSKKTKTKKKKIKTV